MEPIPSYNLLQSIDPTKVKVPISERFAKLTLSSNKKKHKQQEQLNDPEHQGELQILHEKRESISRDLTKQFEMSEAEGKNPLLRSESSKETDQQNSKEIENEESMDRLQVSQETELHLSNCTSIGKKDKEEKKDYQELTMDALQVSNDYDNPTHLENDLELISQKIVSLVVESKPISLSSGSTDNLNDQLLSTESERSSTSADNQIHIVHHIPINVKEALNRENISLNLANSTQADNKNQTYQMADNEEEYSDEEEEAITISDTSESHNEKEPDIMATSSLPSNSQTEGLLLPSLTDDKAERVAAFLRDVSIERRNLMEKGQLDVNDTVDQLISNNDIDKIQETLNKSKQIAAADTESMTADGNEEELTPRPVIDRDTRLKALESLMDRTELLTDDEDEEFKENKDSNRTIENAYERGQNETPRNSKVKNKNFYKTIFDKTESNLDFSFSQFIETPKIENKVRSVTSSENKNNSRRLANIETEENTMQSVTSDESNITPYRLTNEEASNCSNQAEENCQTPKNINPHRLAKEDTLPNSTITDIAKAISEIYDYTPDYKTPKKSLKVQSNSPISLHSTPSSSKDGGEHKHDSIINSSVEHNTTAPEESIVISETDDESKEQQKGTINSDDNKKLSNSFHNNEEDSSSDDSDTNDHQMSELKMSMASISISAKINIIIHIPSTTTTSTETSEDEEIHKKQKKPVNNKQKSLIKENNLKEQEEIVQEISKESECSNQSSASTSAEKVSSKACNQLQRKTIVDENALVCSDKSPDSPEVVEDEKFLTEAEKLLTQLYGKSWQTPDVIRTLKRTSQTGDSKSNNPETSSFKIPDNGENLKDQKSVNKSVAEESVLDDFSIFRRNIVKTNLNSTRLVTSPKIPTQQNKEVLTQPRNLRTTSTRKAEVTKATPTPVSKPSFRTPVAKVVTNKGRVDNGRWRQLVDADSNSEGDNASDDDDADESWSKNASEIENDFSDSDFEKSPKPRGGPRKNNTTKRAGGNNTNNSLAKLINKSKEGELIYLDLTKDEVEVQEEVPASPPANHDATFATHLQDILKTCRREDKPKLPASNKKTKRKLFTPVFGDEDYESVTADKEEPPKEQFGKINCNLNKDEEELLEDCDNCPFDSQARPKVLTLVNKQLESVKMGKPIFQLTPSPKRKEKASPFSTKNIKNPQESNGSSSKSNAINDNNFKTPLTTKSKGPAKSLRDLCITPDFKYSFLKSLDVTVSKTFCHPDALYYRDNYRTKKEDLSKILYDLYNEKLFDNKLNVPISWNKKLSNTAGRCFNKKKMGIRLSAVELSDKVLTSADRLRCTLIHELCHAATWVFNGEGGHGAKWKEWARKANATFPELPKIGVCHQYDIEYKYTYKCTLCAAKSHAHSKSKKVENIRCSYCHGAIEIFMNKKDKDGNIMPTPVREATGFAKFVKDNYKKFKRDDLKHADVMKLLSAEFASLKVNGN